MILCSALLDHPVPARCSTTADLKSLVPSEETHTLETTQQIYSSLTDLHRESIPPDRHENPVLDFASEHFPEHIFKRPRYFSRIQRMPIRENVNVLFIFFALIHCVNKAERAYVSYC